MIKINREFFFIITLTLILIIVGGPYFASGADKQFFSDVNQDDWFFPQVTKLVELGAIDGYPDLTFRPDKLLTKAEFIKILISSLVNEEIEQTSKHWASGYLDTALQSKIVEKKDLKNPDLPISREDMSRLIFNTLSYLGEPSTKQIHEFIPFIRDFDKIPPTYQDYVLTSYAEGIISGYPDGSFKGSRELTRAEASTVILNVLNKDDRQIPYQPIPVLMYHHLLTEKEIEIHGWKGNESVVSVENFNEQMKYLYDNGYNTASLTELYLYLSKDISLPEKTVIITFDDGYLSNAVYAYPIMNQYRFKGSIFLIGNISIRQQDRFTPTGLQYINFQDIDLYKDVFEFGSHSFNLHLQKNGLPAVHGESRLTIKEDFKMMDNVMKTEFIAYPFGAYNDTILEVMKGLDYKTGFTTNPGYVNPKTESYKIPRFGIKQSTPLEDFIKILTVSD